MERKCGIYCIENTITHKKYIGLSSYINKRWREHLWMLENNQHDNSYLQRAWNKYGADAFTFTILEECDVTCLPEREMHYIAKYRSDERLYGYNLSSGGDGPLGRAVIDYRTGIVYPSLAQASRALHKSLNTLGTWCSKRRYCMYYDEWMNLSNVEQQHIQSINWKALEHQQRSESHKVHNLSLETRRKNSEANSGKNNRRSMLIYCHELDEYFWGLRAVTKKYGISNGNLSACLNGRHHSAGKHPVTGEPLTWMKIMKE